MKIWKITFFLLREPYRIAPLVLVILFTEFLPGPLMERTRPSVAD